jgi:PiT family inorganic phosphate transporter
LLLSGVFLAVALVSGNNLSACVGTTIGARILGRGSAKALGAVGLVAGFVIQGRSMAHAAQEIFPIGGILIVSEALFVIVGAFMLAKALKAPLSLSMSLVALLIGLSTSRHLPIDYSFMSTIIGMWFGAPIIAALFTFLSLKIINRTRPRDVWRRVTLYKTLLIIFSFLASYVLGANTVGLITAVGGFEVPTELAAILAILVGSIFLSDREIRRVGEDIFSLKYSSALIALLISTVLVEFATLIAVPLSSTQSLSAGVLGAGTSYEHKAMSLWPFLMIVAAWIIVPVLCFVIGYFL